MIQHLVYKSVKKLIDQLAITLGLVYAQTDLGSVRGNLQGTSINPFTPRSDQHVNSPYNSNTLSSRQVMRIKKIIN